MYKCATQITFACSAALVVALLGCRSKLDVDTKQGNVAGAATATAVEPATETSSSRGTAADVGRGLFSERTFFQSRTPLAVTVADEVAGAGDPVTLTNETTTRSLADMQPLDDDRTLRLAPFDGERQPQLAPGENLLRIIGNPGAVRERAARHSVVRRDFTIFAVGVAGGSPQRRSGLELDVNGWRRAAVSNGQSVLMVGIIDQLSK